MRVLSRKLPAILALAVFLSPALPASGQGGECAQEKPWGLKYRAYETEELRIFYFFREDNWEMLFKVLNGCNFNDHYWVYFAATTDVEFNVRVTDTLTGFSKAYSNTSGESLDYSNPLGQPANAVTDNTAFATCP